MACHLTPHAVAHFNIIGYCVSHSAEDGDGGVDKRQAGGGAGDGGVEPAVEVEGLVGFRGDVTHIDEDRGPLPPRALWQVTA